MLVDLRCLDCICFAGESKPLMCNSLMMFCTPSSSSSSPSSLSILLFVSARMLDFYGRASLPGSVSRTFPYLHPPRFCLLSLSTWHSTYGAFDPCVTPPSSSYLPFSSFRRIYLLMRQAQTGFWPDLCRKRQTCMS